MELICGGLLGIDFGGLLGIDFGGLLGIDFGGLLGIRKGGGFRGGTRRGSLAKPPPFQVSVVAVSVGLQNLIGHHFLILIPAAEISAKTYDELFTPYVLRCAEPKTGPFYGLRTTLPTSRKHCRPLAVLSQTSPPNIAAMPTSLADFAAEHRRALESIGTNAAEHCSHADEPCGLRRRTSQGIGEHRDERRRTSEGIGGHRRASKLGNFLLPKFLRKHVTNFSRHMFCVARNRKQAHFTA